MKELLKFVAVYAVTYWAVARLAPAIEAKIEAMDLDDAWDIFNETEAW